MASELKKGCLSAFIAINCAGVILIGLITFYLVASDIYGGAEFLDYDIFFRFLFGLLIIAAGFLIPTFLDRWTKPKQFDDKEDLL